jgi:threonine/homoserine/homoserine lactone efflux protein
MATATTVRGGGAAGPPRLGLPALFSTSLLVGYSGAMMPGPLLAVCIAEAAQRGFWTAPALVAGHGTLEIVLVAALTAGLGALLRRRSVGAAIAAVGGLVLLWMGQDIARAAWQGSVSLELAPGQGAGPAGPFIAGIVVSASNPYFILWWATVGASYVALARASGAAGLAAFFSGHILADITWYLLIGFLVASGRRILDNTIYRGVLVLCGIFLIGLGIYFVYSAVRGRVRAEPLSASSPASSFLEKEDLEKGLESRVTRVRSTPEKE